MSRYCGNKDSTLILKAADQWQNRCLTQDGSIFSDAQAWQLVHVEALEKYFVNNPDASDASFFAKLESQLEPTAVEVKYLAAEMLWVMFLCPSNIGAVKKREGISTIWSWSGSDFSFDSPWIADETLEGVGSAGTGFNTNRWRELVFFIHFLLAFKALTVGEREQLLSDGWAFAKWLEQVPECNKRQLRHMLVFLLFPDQFERIFGGTDRRTVVRLIRGLKKGQPAKMSALEIDRILFDIRSESEAEYGTAELDFYTPPLRDLWKDKEKRVWLISWSPKDNPWDSLSEDREKVRSGENLIHIFPASDARITIGDTAYVRVVGEGEGIFAVGNVVTALYKDEDDVSWFDVTLSCILDLATDPYLSQQDLTGIKVGGQNWNPDTPTLVVKKKAAGILDAKWQAITKISPKPPLSPVIDPVNMILYGPPGTGKTFRLNRKLESYTHAPQKMDRALWLMQELESVRWFDVIFSALHDLGGSAKVKMIAHHEYIVAKAKALGRTGNINQTIWAMLQSHAREESSTVKYAKRQPPLIFEKTMDSVWELVDDWQDECEDQIEQAREWKRGPEAGSTEKRYAFITFHQAYSYEDFVEGIRPLQDEESSEVVYRVMPGVFRRICQRAQADPTHRYAIFIDEINRGNIAKIFGELITLIELDKRAIYDNDGVVKEGMVVTLPYSGDLFSVPKNLDIYGTMNTADRSIALLDTALRRRFRFQAMNPDPGVINGSRGDGYIEDGEGGLIDLRALLFAMNQRIRFLLNRDMMLGHAYLIDVRNFYDLRQVLTDQVIPLLQEYFYEDWHRIQLVFKDIGPGGMPIEPQIIQHTTLKEEVILGFDHDDYEDLIEYSVAPVDVITPEAVRKIYEGEG